MENEEPKQEEQSISKRSQLKMESLKLNMLLNSRYSSYGYIEPSLEKQKIIKDRIDEINNCYLK